ncbi:MAG: AMP phosphorylase [Promethearchaeota archaeon]
MNLQISSQDLLTDATVIINQEDAQKLKLSPETPLQLTSSNFTSVASKVIVSKKLVNSGLIVISPEMGQVLAVKENDTIDVTIRHPPESFSFIKKRMTGDPYTKEEIFTIIGDILSNHLSPLEISVFLLTQQFRNYTLDEIEYLTRAVASQGDQLDFDEPAYDKHSLGGVPGNKVSLIIVPIVASAGLLIPKTSSRAITSPSGTVDTMECLADVTFTPSEIVEIAQKTRGMIIGGGGLNLAPADAAIIRKVQFPLGLDPKPMMFASIMAKKLAMGIEFVALDVPIGKGTKVPNFDEGNAIGRNFAELARRMDIRLESAITFGSVPVGHAIGPALEAREALNCLSNPRGAPTSLIEKSTAIAGILLEMAGLTPRGSGQAQAKSILSSGKALTKMQEIIEAQNGDPNIKPEDIPIGDHVFEWFAPADGWVVDIDNAAIKAVAKAAGAPKKKGGGVYFVKKKQAIKRGEVILRIHAETEKELKDAQAKMAKLAPITIEGMLLGRI